MQPLLVLFAAALGAAIVFRFVRIVVPNNLPPGVRRNLSFGFVAAGILLTYFRLFGLAFLLLAVGASLALRRITDPARSASRGQSHVSSMYLAMSLDHETGDMDGKILAGDYQGRMLSDFDLAALLDLATVFSDDAESVNLLETYLDRAHPGWRDDVAGSTGGEQETSQGSRRISKVAAYRVLGLQPGASESEIREAYHRLIKRVHPDHGGTAELAAQINQARDRLLESH